MPLITFGTLVRGDLAAGSRREWLLADGLGGYAMGTVSGLRTRRYHGLLTIAGPNGRRRLGLASLDPRLVLPSAAEAASLRLQEAAPAVPVPRPDELTGSVR